VGAAVNDAGTCNFGTTSFTYTVPSGFAGWPGPAPVAQQPNKGTIPISQRIAPSYDDEQLAQEWSYNQRVRNYHTTWAINVAQIEVSKFITYDVLSAPDATDVSKFITYVVLEEPDALDVSKFVTYLVLQDVSVPQLPYTPPLLFRQAPQWEELEADDASSTQLQHLLRLRNRLTNLPGTNPTPVAQLPFKTPLLFRQAPQWEEIENNNAAATQQRLLNFRSKVQWIAPVVPAVQLPFKTPLLFRQAPQWEDMDADEMAATQQRLLNFRTRASFFLPVQPLSFKTPLLFRQAPQWEAIDADDMAATQQRLLRFRRVVENYGSSTGNAIQFFVIT